MISPLPFRALASLGVGLGSLVITSCGPGPVVCYGGGRQMGDGCFCARGQTWDGSQCVGTPETGSCTQKGAMEVVSPAGSACFCPDGWIWTDQNRVECVACGGGSLAQGDTACVCPEGTAWIENACQAVQQPVAEVPQPMSCTGGAIATDQGCQCPQGTGWDGASCAGGQGPQPIEIHQHTIQSSQSFTCCVNHSKYSCPNDAAFQACATLNPNHGCTPAGGC